jgi:hypothetical protein
VHYSSSEAFTLLLSPSGNVDGSLYQMTDSFVPFEPRPDHRHQYVPTERANGSLRRFAPPYSSSNQVLGSPTQSNPSIGSAGSGRTVTQSSFTPHIEIDQDITPIEASHRPAWYDTVELDSPIQARPVRSIDNTTRMAELERAKNMTVPMQLEADKDLLQGPFTKSLSTELQDEADVQGRCCLKVSKPVEEANNENSTFRNTVFPDRCLTTLLVCTSATRCHPSTVVIYRFVGSIWFPSSRLNGTQRRSPLSRKRTISRPAG